MQAAITKSGPAGVTPVAGGLLQRKCACGKNAGGGACGRGRTVTVRRAVVENSRADEASASATSSVRDVLGSAGHPFDSATRAYMESRFGRDLSGVPARSFATTRGALNVVAADHPSEREADRIARRVTRTSAPSAQTHAAAAQTSAAPSHNVRGHDFGGVRLHTDARASESALALGARAYSAGDNIVFAHGQYNPSTHAGRELIAHELAHVVQSRAGGAASHDDALHRKTFATNEEKCTATLTYLVQLIFDDTDEDRWTKSRRTSFRTKFKESIESTFNANSYHIKPDAASYEEGLVYTETKSCPCADTGFTPRVKIRLTGDGVWSTKEDWEVDVAANKAGAGIQSETNTSYGDLDEADVDPVAKESSAPGVTQVPAVHEFGHFMGLDHPGVGLEGGIFSKSKLSPGANEYGHTGTDSAGRAVDGPNDLMGAGMGLRPFYFDNWRDELASKYGSSCGWKTS
jgi:hypothetical protein